MCPQAFAVDNPVPALSLNSEYISVSDLRYGCWMRSCPICALPLSKPSPQASVYCACGWEWKG
jgi:hypothetical protein